jgi:hypothetical protein
MKKISMLLLALALPLAHAMPTTQAKVIRTKQWATNNAKVNFRLAPTVKAQDDNSHTRYMNVDATTTPQNGVVGTPNTYTSDNAFNFYNDTNEAQTVYFVFYTCIDDKAGDQAKTDFSSQCGYYSETVEVQPKGIYNKEYIPEVTVNFTKPGEYTLSSGTMSNFDSSINRRVSATSSAKITVTG